MPFNVPNEGEVQLLTDLLGGGALENWSLRLFKSNTTPAETDTAATYTPCDFTGYAPKTLTRSISAGTWQTVASGAPTGAWSAEAAVAKSSYGSAPQSWTCGAAGNTVYGYSLVGATSGKLICAEAFATPRTLAGGDTLAMTPVMEAA